MLNRKSFQLQILFFLPSSKKQLDDFLILILLSLHRCWRWCHSDLICFLSQTNKSDPSPLHAVGFPSIGFLVSWFLCDFLHFQPVVSFSLSPFIRSLSTIVLLRLCVAASFTYSSSSFSVVSVSPSGTNGSVRFSFKSFPLFHCLHLSFMSLPDSSRASLHIFLSATHFLHHEEGRYFTFSVNENPS